MLFRSRSRRTDRVHLPLQRLERKPHILNPGVARIHFLLQRRDLLANPLNLLLLVAVMSLFGATLTLPGLARGLAGR